MIARVLYITDSLVDMIKLKPFAGKGLVGFRLVFFNCMDGSLIFKYSSDGRQVAAAPESSKSTFDLDRVIKQG